MSREPDVWEDHFNRLFARTVQQAEQRQEAERRAREWPGEVEQLLVALAGAVRDLSARVAELEAGQG